MEHELKSIRAREHENFDARDTAFTTHVANNPQQHPMDVLGELLTFLRIPWEANPNRVLALFWTTLEAPHHRRTSRNIRRRRKFLGVLTVFAVWVLVRVKLLRLN